MTLEGNIIVGGVLASCYATVHHDVGHIMMTPLRWFPRMTEWILGDSVTYVNVLEEIGKLCFDQIIKKCTYLEVFPKY